MTQVASNAHRVEIIAAAPTTLDAAIAALNTQIAGGGSRWYQMANPANSVAVLGSQTGSSGSICLYGSHAVFNSFNQSIDFAGADHGNYPSMSYCRLPLSTYAWSKLSGSNGGGGGTDSGLGPGHNFAQQAINPFNGDEYYHVYGSGGSVGGFQYEIVRAAYNSSTYAHEFFITVYSTITSASGWWSGAFNNGSFSSGAHGMFVAHCYVGAGASTDGTLVFYNPLTGLGAYQQSASPFAGDSYQHMGAYSPVYNCFVYGGAGSNVQQMWKLSSNGTVSAMPPSFGTANDRIGCQRGNFWCDPVTGKFLLLTNGPTGALWELDPTGSGTWVHKTASAYAPPANLAIDPTDTNHTDGTIVCPITDAGRKVTFLFRCPPPGTATQHWIYLHA